jgi:hypothetical protein
MISRSQMNRQLYMGGGITQLPMNQIMVPRGEYGLGSIVKSVGKAVKGVAKGIGDIAKSDIGKAALLAAGSLLFRWWNFWWFKSRCSRI